MATVQLLEIILTAAAIVLSIVGIIANCMSLSYFIKRQNKGLGNRLIMLLNFCDLVVSSICAFKAILNHLFPYGDPYSNVGATAQISSTISNFIYAIYAISFDCTGFSTCLISVCRTIKVCRPFFVIEGVWVAASFILYFFCSAAREITCNYIYYMKPMNDLEDVMKYYPLIFSLGTTFNIIATFISSVITLYWLTKKSTVRGSISKNKRHATVTVLILSTVFCPLNTIFISACVVYLCINFQVIKLDTTWWIHRTIVSNMMACLNSIINPIIYLTRKEEMRRFVLEIWRTFKDKFRTRAEENVVELTLRSHNDHPPVHVGIDPNIISDIFTRR